MAKFNRSFGIPLDAIFKTKIFTRILNIAVIFNEKCIQKHTKPFRQVLSFSR
mgnify:CR=1 FL=1